jgi:Asp-tRNA(Asn)/Glu-tRNA(Gln) amidotransferase A subunit family amidase
MARSVADVAVMWSVLTGEPVPEPRLAGLTVGLLTSPPPVGDDVPAESLQAEQWAADLERLGASVVAASLPRPSADTWPLFFHEAARSHRETFPSRAGEYGENCRTKLELAQRVDPRRVADAYHGVEEWRRYQPEVDLFVAPCFTIDLPADDVDELEVRIPFSEWLRWVNLIGWAALAIGNLQLIAPRDETVLAAGLAWELGQLEEPSGR